MPLAIEAALSILTSIVLGLLVIAVIIFSSYWFLLGIVWLFGFMTGSDIASTNISLTHVLLATIIMVLMISSASKKK